MPLKWAKLILTWSKEDNNLFIVSLFLAFKKVKEDITPKR